MVENRLLSPIRFKTPRKLEKTSSYLRKAETKKER